MTLLLWLISLVILGEAIALFVGIFIIKRNKEWFSVRNINYLLIDIISGGGLTYMLLSNYPLHDIIFYELLIVGIISHLLRLKDYLLKGNNLFCFNKPLFFANNFKLGGLLIVLLLLLL